MDDVAFNQVVNEGLTSGNWHQLEEWTTDNSKGELEALRGDASLIVRQEAEMHFLKLSRRKP